MSFILDALKKSENERQRQAGPGFATVPEGSKQKTRSLWPVIAVALVAVNLVVLGAILMRDDAGQDPDAAAPTTARPAPPARPPGSPAAPAGRAAIGGDEAVRAAPAEETAAVRAPAAAPEVTPPVPGDDRQVRGLAGEVMPDARTEPAVPASVSSPEPTPPGTVPDPTPAATVPAPPAARPPKPRATSGGDALPTANDLRLEGFLTGPPLHLDLHVYYPERDRRVVFISGARYREGDRLSNGSVVREIVPEGVVLEDRGRRYLLLPD